jgi:DNA polymerase-3 subunit delta
MIIKSYELKKLDLNKNKYILFYGANEGAKTEEINRLKLLNKDKTFINYEEKQILENSENIYNNIFSKSLFENKKIITINRTTDKLLKIIEDVLEKNFVDIYLIFISDNLEKKSKLRSLFEKRKELTCVAFYPDTPDTLSKMTHNFFRERKILISQAHINLIVNKCNGDRGILKNELSKIELFLKNKTKISSENLLKLVNLVENHSISELIDNCLAKNQKKTINILNDNNFSSEDCIIITRTFINKSKRIMKLSQEYQSNGNLDTTIANAKPPIFWKDKEIVKQQINKWSPNQISELIYSLNEIELQIKKNYTNPVNIVSDFILNQASTSS